jgi:hypothetical protein
MTTRDEVINAADCPACGAERGSPCLGIARRNGHRRPRKSAHAERWKAAGDRTYAPAHRCLVVADPRDARTQRRLKALERVEWERRDLEAIATLNSLRE